MGNALRWAKGMRGDFDFPPYIPLDPHIPLETSRGAPLHPGLMSL